MKDITVQPEPLAELLISARLLMLQSKRLLLAGMERRSKQKGRDSLRVEADRLREETKTAHEQYCSYVLRLGSPATPDYWPVAYGRLVETAAKLSAKLRGASTGLPPEERYQVAAEVEILETLAEEWRESIRKSIVAVA
jgi:hypothetical protein